MKRLTTTQSQKQRQATTLNIAMRESLEVLSMPLPELNQYVNQQLLENPLLDTEDYEYTQEEQEVLSFVPISTETNTEYRLEDFFDGSSDEHWKTKSRRSTGHLDFFDAFNLVANAEQDFKSMLREQINTQYTDVRLKSTCLYLIDCLDSRGYFCDDLSICSEEVGIPYREMENALITIQELNPIGVAARSLQECLTLQLAHTCTLNPYTNKIVHQGLELLARNDMKKLSQLLHCNLETAIVNANLIKSLNPIPSRGFSTSDNQIYIIPDAVVELNDQDVRVIINDLFSQKLRISTLYEHSTTDNRMAGADKRYIAEMRQKAKNVIRSINERNHTLYRIILFIVMFQSQYFSDGVLLPLTLADVSTALGIHISTVSRAVKNKYISSPVGTISLQSLFTQTVSTTKNLVVSSAHTRLIVKQLITNEDPLCPLTDEQLRICLEKQDIFLSRRVIAKYREELNIENSKNRKKNKAY